MKNTYIKVIINLQYRNITISQYRNITISQYHNITITCQTFTEMHTAIIVANVVIY